MPRWKKQNLLFNLDDTLSQCNIYFDRVGDEFADRLTQWFPGAKREDIQSKQTELDLASVDVNGLSTAHFAESFVKTYRFYCDMEGIAPDAAREKELLELGNSVFEIPVEPLPGMYETLEKLRAEGHELYLHTGGEEKNQRRKIAQLQLAAFFDNRVFISLHKDRDALRKILAQMQFIREDTWMIGNSLRTDIMPGIEEGINVIYIPAQTEWEYNMVEVEAKPRGAYLTLKELREVPEAIRVHLEKRLASGRV